MSRLGAWPLLGALLVVAFALSLATGSEEQLTGTPSVTNPGPRGLEVLFTWLTEAGFDVRRGDAPLTEVPNEIATIVIPAPTAALLDEADVRALEGALARGTTVLLFVPRGTGRKHLAPLVKLRSLSGVPLEPLPLDGAGSTLSVVHEVGVLRGVRRLRVAAEPGVRVLDADALPLTDPPLLWARRIGAGTLYVAAGAELAENGRLDLEDNARLWLNVAARGPIWFDETHHRARVDERPTVNLWAFGLQFAFAAALFVVARGTRVGPVREEPPPLQRSTTEYVEAMAQLTHRAKLDAELVEDLRRQVRLMLHERLGLSLELSDEERARASGLPDALELFRDQNFLSLSRRLAAVEARLYGRSAS